MSLLELGIVSMGWNMPGAVILPEGHSCLGAPVGCPLSWCPLRRLQEDSDGGSTAPLPCSAVRPRASCHLGSLTAGRWPASPPAIRSRCPSLAVSCGKAAGSAANSMNPSLLLLRAVHSALLWARKIWYLQLRWALWG